VQKSNVSVYVVIALSVCLLVALNGSRLNAQAVTANVSGTVTDSSGAVITDASVDVTNVDTGVKQTVPTNAQGRYSVPGLPIGNYSIQASKTGFQTVIHSGITLTVGSQPVVDFAMPVGQAQQQVQVTGQVSQVETNSAAVGSLVGQQQMEDLPLNGRNYEQLLSLAPGVSTAAQGTSAFYGNQQNYSIGGSRAEGQAFLLDNTDVQGFWAHGTGSAATGASLGVEAIAEFNVLTNTYSAQFPGSGSVINAVTKSGTNSFHGSAYEFLRNDVFDAKNYFNTTAKPGFRQNQFGGSVGGPIKRDKLFFFGNYEGVRNSLGETGTAFVPDAGAQTGIVPIANPNAAGGYTLTNVGINPLIAPILKLYPAANGKELTTTETLTNGTKVTIPTGVATYSSTAALVQHEDYILGRVDYTLSPKDTVYGRYISDRANVVTPYTSSQIPLWPETDTSANQYLTTEWRRVISPNLLNIARFAFVRTDERQAAASPFSALDFTPGRPNGEISPGSGISTIGANTLTPNTLIQNKFTEADDIVWTKGAHSLHFGVDVVRVQSNIFAPFIFGGEYSFSNVSTFLGAVPSTFLGVGPSPTQDNAQRYFREIDISPYVQDDWKFSNRLTFNFGLRWDYVTNPTGYPLNAIVNPGPSATGFTPVSNVFAHNVNAKNLDPRFGFAFDPFSDHKTSIRGGFGIFHDPIAPREYASAYYLAPPFAFGVVIAPKTFPNPYPNYVPPANPLAGNGVSILEGMDYQVGAAPYYLQYNLNIQREVLPNTVFQIGFVASQGRHLTMQIDQNPPTIKTNAAGQQIFGTVSPTSGLLVPNPRINPNFSYVNNAIFEGTSSYNSLQASLNRRFVSNLTAQVSYTWSKCIDIDSGSFGLEGANNITDPYDPELDRGRCNYDAEQNFRLNALYALPFHGGRAVSGWRLSGIQNVNSGSPVYINDGFDNAGLQNSDPRPNLLPNCTLLQKRVTQWYNPNCLQIAPPGTLGDLSRNVLSGPGYVDTDFAVLKDTKITEGINTQFRAEFFNIFNHPNFSQPSGAAFTQVPGSGGGNISPTAGVISSTGSNAPRQIQFALKILF
jgi:outer membrane receptor protein involved in Fe transport